MKAKRVIRLELSDEDARQLSAAIKEMNDAARDGSKLLAASVWFDNPILEEMLKALLNIAP